MIDIKCGDYAELVKNIPDGSIDLLLTDPPYEHVSGGCTDKKHWNHNGVYDGDSFMNKEMSSFGRKEVFDFLDAVLPKMKKVNAYIFCSRLQLAHYFAYINNHKKLKYDLLFWNKATAGGYMVRTTKVFTNDIEYIIRLYEPYVSLNRFKKEDGTLESQYYLKNQTFGKIKGDHDAAKPEALMERLLKLSSNEGDTVFDPFLGSGTTGVVAKLNNRNFIGFEKEERFFNIAKDRLERTEMQFNSKNLI